MSSPFRAPDPSKPTPRSSPSRSRYSDIRNAQVNSYRRYSRDSISDSPSRSLYEEFSKLILDDDRSFNRTLDAQAAEQERLHRQALDQALAQHEAVRQSAERARERVELEIRREQRRREELERQELEEQRRKLAEEERAREKRRLEDAKQREEERRQAEALKRQQEEHERSAAAQRQREQQDKEERDRRAAKEREDAARKIKEEEDARRKQQQATQPAPSAPTPKVGGLPPARLASTAAAASPKPPDSSLTRSSQGLVSTLEQRKAVHSRYLHLWKHLKQFRAWTEAECRKAGFKQLGEMKRTIRTQLGMVNKLDKVANRSYLSKIETVLKQASTLTTPTVDITPFLPNVPQATIEATSPTERQFPAILLYLLNQLAKCGVKQLVSENETTTDTADPLGIILIQIFARTDYQWRGNHSLIDLLWAKYHVLCPQLFGIPAKEVDHEAYWWRCTGLAAGFSALTLRDFSRSRLVNPAPNTMWWEAIARILNTPPDQLQATHYVLIKALIEEFVPRIIGIFGGAGRALLKTAVVDFPLKGPRAQASGGKGEARPLPAVLALQSMQMTLQQKYGLSL